MSSRGNLKVAVDSAATTHCFPHFCQGGTHQEVSSTDSIGVICANNKIINSTATDIIDLKRLPPRSHACDKFCKITLPLVSVKHLCESDFEVHFKGKHVTITDQCDTTILAGLLDPTTELYMVKLHDHKLAPDADALPGGNNTDPSPVKVARSAYTIKTVPALINFYHITLGAPPIASLIKAINLGWF